MKSDKEILTEFWNDASFARKIWPRALIKKFLGNYGLFMLIDARKI